MNVPVDGWTLGNDERYHSDHYHNPSTQKSPAVKKYDEDRILDDLKNYIERTYDEHYSRNNFQATEFIMDSGHGEGFCIGNIMKYAQRYGKKNGKDRKDLLKVAHYCIMAIYNHDKEYEQRFVQETLI